MPNVSNCPTCRDTIAIVDQLVCLECSKRSHRRCALSQPKTSPDGALFSWACETCLTGNQLPLNTSHFNAIMSQLGALTSAISICNTRIAEMNNLIVSHSTEISLLRDENNLLKHKISAVEVRLNNPCSSEEIINESEDRRRCSKNVILSGLQIP
ncbi:hypothetical protein JTB14_025739 [Gonioctena quinquepunctata]|nr:hypothetical protein JTB14_025739 [Gonioctena quinquepunctata]